MARPTKTDDPRHTILEAARHLLRSGGHRALSLRGVAAKAGFSPASLYEYFDGKADLTAALAADASSRLRDRMAAAVEGAAKPCDTLVELGMAYVAFARSHREDFLLLFAMLESKRTGLDRAIAEESPYALLATAARSAFADSRPRVSPRAVEDAAYALWATAHGMAMLQLTHLKAFDADFIAVDRKALRALVRGLGLLA